MPISELQLETWSRQGSITQSSTTYNSIKQVLESPCSPYAAKDFSVFLQGSYGNDTNIYSESDVDLVVLLRSTFRQDISALPESQITAFNLNYPSATYLDENFRADVFSVLANTYGGAVKSGKKAITIDSNGNRRKADVIAAIEYRRYHQFTNIVTQSYTQGISFITLDGELIINYPRLHSENLIVKQKQTGNFKAVTRIFKNLRGRLIEEGLLTPGTAPSYYLEGLLYNVPIERFFESDYQKIVANIINWIYLADRSKFVCANEQYYLLNENSPVTWRENQCNDFLDAAIQLWNQW